MHTGTRPSRWAHDDRRLRAINANTAAPGSSHTARVRARRAGSTAKAAGSPARPGPAARPGGAGEPRRPCKPRTDRRPKGVFTCRPGAALCLCSEEGLPALAPARPGAAGAQARHGAARPGTAPPRRRAAAGRRGRVLPQSRPGRRGKRLRGTKVPAAAAAAARPAGSPGARGGPGGGAGSRGQPSGLAPALGTAGGRLGGDRVSQ